MAMSPKSIRQKTHEFLQSTPEYKVLVAAVGKDRPVTELKDLAAAADVNANGLADLVQIATAARANKPMAARWPEVERKWNKLNTAIADAEGRLARAVNDEERTPISEELERLWHEHKSMMLGEWSTCNVAAQQYKAAKDLGLVD